MDHGGMVGPNGSGGGSGMGSMGMGHEGLGSPPPAKMMRRGEGPRVELRFLIASKVAGVIIGRGGQTIKKLREDYAARVSIPDSNGPERIMVLEGDLGTLMAMLEEILPRMDESHDFSGYGRDGGMGMSDGSIDLRMLVHQSQIGCIIGRGGFNIRDLREKLPLRLLKVHPSVCPSSTDRVVQMVGPHEIVLQCTQKISEMLETTPPKGPRNNYTARGFNEFAAAGDYGGYQSTRPDGMGGGGGGGSMMGGRGGGGGGSMMGGRGGGGGGGGGGMGGNMDMGMHGGPMGDFGAPGAMGGNMFGGGGPSGPGMGPGGPGGPGVPPSEKTTTQVSLPDKLTGSIMGKGGSRINQIRQQSGAEITINPQEPGSSDRIITIRGSTEQIHKAQFLMQLCVKRFSGHY